MICASAIAAREGSSTRPLMVPFGDFALEGPRAAKSKRAATEIRRGSTRLSPVKQDSLTLIRSTQEIAVLYHFNGAEAETISPRGRFSDHIQEYVLRTCSSCFSGTQ